MSSTDADDQPGKAERERLAAIAARVDRLITSPGEVGGRLARFFAPVYRALGWQAKFGSKKLGALLDELRVVGVTLPSKTFDAAVRELERNLTIAERCVAVSRRVPTAYASWMQRVLDALRRVAAIDHARVDQARRASGAGEARRLGGMDATRLAPPLRLDLDAKHARPSAPPPKPGEPATEDARRKHGEAIAKDPSKARLLELQLAAIDQITEAARSETRFLERRRRLLEGARRLLLDASAALPLDAEGVRARERALADQITHIHRLVASGLDPRVALPFQARSAARRGDRERVYAALAALERFGEFVGDGPLGVAAARALDRGGFNGGAGANAELAERASRDRSVREVFGQRVADEVTRQYDRARAAARARAGLESSSDDAELRALTIQYLAPGAEDAAFAALLSADGCFEVGAALSPVRSREVEEIARLVSHPTREMLLVQARSMEDLRSAVIDDPRTVLLDLASGRMLARRFVERAQRVRERTHLAGEVRVFVLDASTSMLDEGIDMSRARMRDAILVGELATMIRRLDEPGRRVRLSLYYRFFTKRMGELRKVSTGSEAIAAMADFIGKTRTGGTAIQDALVTSFELIRDQKREDPELARASIVLVTDGAAPVDAELLRRAREDAGMPINVSVIALGEENPVLRDLVARQRANGERAFYHFVDDDRLAALCRGDGSGRAIHAPPALLTHEDREAERAALSTALEDALVEVEDLGRTRAAGDAAAPPAAPGSEGQKALAEAEHRDRLALERRYLRWFPRAAPTKADEPAVPAVSSMATEDVDAVVVLLATIAEIVGELGGDPFHRQADAIEIVERLLVDAQLTAERYLAVVASRDPRVSSALDAVHLSLRPVSDRPMVAASSK